MTKDQAEEEGLQGDHCLRAGGDETILDGDEELRCGEWKSESKFLQTNIKTWSGRNASNQEAKPWCSTCFAAAQGVQDVLSQDASVSSATLLPRLGWVVMVGSSWTPKISGRQITKKSPIRSHHAAPTFPARPLPRTLIHVL